MSKLTTIDHEIVAQFDTYEEYLDSRITQDHIYYLGSRETARQIYELGCAGGPDVMARKKFEQKKQELADQKTTKRNSQVPLAHLNVDKMCDSPLMQKLASIEDDVRNGQKVALIFIRSINSHKQEVSAYIDYGDRLKQEDWRLYFSGKKLLKPLPTDLSFYNSKTRTVHTNNTSNFEVKSDSDSGIIVNNKKDLKEFSLDPAMKDNPGDNTVRIDIDDPNYLHCVLYIHSSRRKT